MNEVIESSSKLPAINMRHLQVRTDKPAFVRFSIQYSLLIGAGTGIVFFHEKSLWLWGGSCLVFALFCATLFAPLHECCHYTAFKTRKWNEVVAWLSGFWLLLTPTAYREFHYEHHRHTHHPDKDPELMVGKEKLVFLPTLLHEYLILSSGIAMVLVKIVAMLALAIGLPKKYWEGFLAFVKEKFRSEITKEARIYLLIYVVCIALLWQYPRILLGFGLSIALAHSFLAVYLMAEHTGLPTEGSILNKGRSMQTHRLLRFFMWNMPYHVEHHAYPSVPFHAIPQLHDLLAEHLPHQEKGYLPFHWKVIKKLKLF